jgi:hypothetical protein
MQKIKYIVLFSTVFGLSLNASERPRWITETPSGFRNDFFIGYGESKVLEEAKLLSEESAKSQVRSKRSGINFSEQNIVERHIEQEPNLYRVWSLVSFPKPFEEQSDPPTKSTYLWRSALVPSYGQFSKGESAKGYFIAGGTAVFLTSGFILSNLKITAESDAKNSRTQTLRNYYNDNANTYNNISLACFIATAAVYVYNVVDAVAADGEKVYVYQSQNRNDKFAITQNQYPKSQNILFIKIEF